jgi:hypothetical protein
MSTSFQGPEGGIFHFLLQGYANLSTLFFCEDTSIVGLDKWQTRICCCGEPLTNTCAATSRRSSLRSGRGAISDQQFVFNIPAQAEHYIGGEVIMLSNRRAATALGNFPYSTPTVISAFGLQIQYSITCNTQSGFPLSIQNASTHIFLSSGIPPRAWTSTQVHPEQDFLLHGCLFGPFLCHSLQTHKRDQRSHLAAAPLL